MHIYLLLLYVRTCLTVPVARREGRRHRDGRPEGVGGGVAVALAEGEAAVAAVVPLAPVARRPRVVDRVVDGAAVGAVAVAPVAVGRQARAARAAWQGRTQNRSGIIVWSKD